MTARLFHSLVAHEGRKPERWALFLHGILGSGANWRSFARRILAERPAWGAVLVDLRKHGNSQDFAGPHTVAACAEDLFALHSLVDGPIRAVVGHSFGGKVALAYSADRETLGDPLDLVVAIDSNPGLRASGTGSAQIHAVLDALASLPTKIPSREAFSDHLRARAMSDGLIAWLMMNLRPSDDGFVLRLELDAIRALLADYFNRDDWWAIEHPGSTRIATVIGGKSPAFSREDRARVEAIARKYGELRPVHVIEHSGHWVHVDAPDELAAIVIEELSRTDRLRSSRVP